MKPEEIPPTRAELLAIRRKIRLVEIGHRVLKMKRDLLLHELMDLITDARVRRQAVREAYARASRTIAVAQMMEGSTGIRITAISVEETPEILVSHRNVMGLVIPVLSAPGVERPLEERGYGLLGTSSVIDEAAEEYERLVAAIIRDAEVGGAIRLIADEIGRTRRRVNALERRVFPSLIAARDRVIRRRDELEREEFSRLFWIKKRKDERRR